MPLIEDRSRPSSMAVASRCTTAPIAAVPAIGTDAAERRFGNNPEAAWTRISSELAEKDSSRGAFACGHDVRVHGHNNLA